MYYVEVIYFRKGYLYDVKLKLEFIFCFKILWCFFFIKVIMRVFSDFSILFVLFMYMSKMVFIYFGGVVCVVVGR